MTGARENVAFCLVGSNTVTENRICPLEADPGDGEADGHRFQPVI